MLPSLNFIFSPQNFYQYRVFKKVSCFSGITNYDEYSLVRDIGEEKKEEITGTLKRDKTLLRDDKKMEKLKQKLHTDDECMNTHTQALIMTVCKIACPVTPKRYDAVRGS